MLQLIIEDLQAEFTTLKSQSLSEERLKRGILLEEDEGPSPVSGNILYQNSPNPFSDDTKIEYYLAEGTKNAMICIYDMEGTQLKCIPLHHKGNGNISINGNEFNAGMYMYALIADGNAIDTKRMILTE